MADDGNTGAGEDTSDSLPMIPAVTDQEKDIGNMVSYICFLWCYASAYVSGEIFYDHTDLLSGDIRLYGLGLCDSFFDAISGICRVFYPWCEHSLNSVLRLQR